MSIYEYIKEELGDREFDTIAEYNECVRAIAEDMECELGKAERYYTSDKGWKDTDVVIKEVLDEEEKVDREIEAKYHQHFGTQKEDGTLMQLYRVYYKNNDETISCVDYECENYDEAREQFNLQKEDESGWFLRGTTIDKVERIA